MKVHTHATRTTRELLLHAQDLKFVEVPPAIFGRKIETIEIVFLGELIELVGELVRYFDLLLHLLKRAFDQFADLLEICLEHLVSDSCIWIHIYPPMRRLNCPYCEPTYERIQIRKAL